MQRSPGYYFPESGKSILYSFLKKFIGERISSEIARIFYFLFYFLTMLIASYFPNFTRKVIRMLTIKHLPKGFDVDVHFKPRYNVWEERACLIKDADFFRKVILFFFFFIFFLFIFYYFFFFFIFYIFIYF